MLLRDRWPSDGQKACSGTETHYGRLCSSEQRSEEGEKSDKSATSENTALCPNARVKTFITMP